MDELERRNSTLAALASILKLPTSTPAQRDTLRIRTMRAAFPPEIIQEIVLFAVAVSPLYHDDNDRDRVIIQIYRDVLLSLIRVNSTLNVRVDIYVALSLSWRALTV